MMPVSRRTLLKMGAAALICPHDLLSIAGGQPPVQAAAAGALAEGVVVNDIHSQLNATRVARIARPSTVSELVDVVRTARREGTKISIAGGRHAMGGQQFGAGTLLVDMNGLGRVLSLDDRRGIVEAEAGIQWPQLLDGLAELQRDTPPGWGIRQKQTGADRLSLGGALAANVHGRGLAMKPLVDDVESFDLVDAAGNQRHCSRSENADLFRLVIGGYGLFGIVTRVRLRLMPRQKVERVVELRPSREVMEAFDRRIADGYLFGDFQFATESSRDSFLRRGVFSCYRPVDNSTPIPGQQRGFSPQDWERLTYYAHTRKRRAFDTYSQRYLQTSGQIYWSDTHQTAYYVDDYHAELDRRTRARTKATEMITEIYVPRAALHDFLEAARPTLRQHKANVIYGTIRLIERDDLSFLAWARQPYACVIFNLHLTHDAPGVEAAARAFRALIDLGIRFDGSYYLTYHRWATRQQVETCYPQFAEFLRWKKHYDPEEMFQSEWYAHYRTMFASP